jgi:magnesium-transporting ATPase (P-type)
LHVGDIILVRPGARVAADGVVVEGSADVDESMITGESRMISKGPGGLRWDAPKETAYPTTFLIDRHDVVFFRKVSRAHGDRTTADDVLAELEHAKAGH